MIASIKCILMHLKLDMAVEVGFLRMKRIAGEHFGNTSGYSPMVFEHHDFEALQC